MLGCTYDELKQRHRDYMFRRVIVGVSAAAVLAVGVTAFTLYQAAKTETQYQEAVSYTHLMQNFLKKSDSYLS